ncbi:alpha/beta hydrolase [Roseicella frigidaeris]|uniref:Lipase n=1 Tax=Roseicella frigidaeris TaxID=2230885 RepID=A0A327M5A8_9PROT|nr:alpha/beta hydrolase [Roseicella frigidaeris]RAI58090.1 lipase [Roseicella frigidaeris]
MTHPRLSRRGTLLGALALAGCQTTAMDLSGTGTVAGASSGAGKPAALLSANTADPAMGQVLQAFIDLGAKPVSTLSVEQARRQPSMADAARRVMQQQGLPTTPRPVAQVLDLMIPGPRGRIPARLYNPGGGNARLPLILYWHGGGWVIADLDTYDASARALAAETGAIVLSCHYRQAPEHKFPAAHDDALAAYAWAVGHAERLGADRHRVALAGESAGGNLALATALGARDQRMPMPAHMLLVYPVAGTDTRTPSYLENTAAIPLGRDDVLWFVDKLTRSPLDLQDPRLDVIGKADLRGLPPATILNAGIDPLRSDGERLAQALRAAGVAAEQRTWAGATHEFFGLAAVVPDAAEAQRLAATRLRGALGLGAVPLAGS